MNTRSKNNPFSRETLFNTEAKPLLQGQIMTLDVDDMSLQEAADAWQLLESIKSKIEPKLKKLREVLLSATERKGTLTEKGGHQLLLDGAKIERQKKTANCPDEDAVFNILAARDINIKDIYDEVKILNFNPSKADFLIKTGRISKEEIDAHRKVTLSLKVKKADKWVELFEDSKSESKGIPKKRFAH